MKAVHHIWVGLLVCTSISPLSGKAQVTDDDVYVMKAPVLPTGSEINDEGTYENYRYGRDRGDYDVSYGSCRRNFMIWSPVYMGYGAYYNSFGGTYSAFNDPFYYPWPGYGYPMGYMFGMNGYGCNGMYNYGTSPNWQFASFYGYGYYPGPGYNYYNGNNYGNNYNNTNNSKFVSHNTHSGPRNSLGGINNSRRSHSSGMKGMATQSHRGASSYTASANNKSTDVRPGRTSPSATRTATERSKPVEAGRGLSKPGHDVSSSSSGSRRSTAVDAGSSSSHPARTSSPRISSPSRNTEFPSSGGSGTVGGGSRGGSSTPSHSTSSPGRRGG